MEGGLVPYVGYVEIHLQILGVKNFDDDDAPMLVLEESPYGNRMPIQIGTLHIEMSISLITQEETNVMSRKWKRSRIVTLLAVREAFLKAGHVLIRKSNGFTIDKVSATIKTTRLCKLLLFKQLLFRNCQKQKAIRKG